MMKRTGLVILLIAFTFWMSGNLVFADSQEELEKENEALKRELNRMKLLFEKNETTAATGSSSDTESGEKAKEEKVELEEVVVKAKVPPTARPLPAKYKDHPAAVTVVPREEIERFHYTSLDQILKRIPGFNPQVRDTRGLFPAFSARGTDPFGGGSVKVLVDGAPIGANLSDPDVRYFVPTTDEMETIEVIKGANTIRYGEQAIGGVVNMITRSIPETPELRMNSSFSSRGTSDSSVSCGRRHGTMGYRLGYHRTVGDNFRENDNYTEDTGSLRLTFDPDPKTDVALTLNYYRLDADVPGDLTKAQFHDDETQASTPADNWEINRFSGALNIQRTLSEASMVEASIIGNNLDRTFYGTDATRLDSKLIGTDLAHTLTTDLYGMDNTLVTGIAIEVDRRDSLGTRLSSRGGKIGTTRSYGTIDDLLIAPYFVNTLKIAEPFTLTGGVRYVTLDVQNRDNFNSKETDQTFDEILWSTGATYRPIEHLTFFGNIQRTFQVPTRQAFTTGGNFAGINFGQEGVDAQTAIQYDVGFRAAPAEWLSLDLTVFRIDYDNRTTITDLNGDGISEFLSIGETRHQGVEARVDLGIGMMLEKFTGRSLPGLSGLGMFTNLALLDAEVRKFKANLSGNDVPYSPDVVAGWGMVYSHPRGFSANIEGLFTDDQFSDVENTREGTADGTRGIIPNRTVWNLNVEQDLPWRKKGGQKRNVYISVRNLFDRKYIETRLSSITPASPITVTGGMSWSF